MLCAFLIEAMMSNLFPNDEIYGEKKSVKGKVVNMSFSYYSEMLGCLIQINFMEKKNRSTYYEEKYSLEYPLVVLFAFGGTCSLACALYVFLWHHYNLSLIYSFWDSLNKGKTNYFIFIF